jgi:hypothetical protein
MLKGREDRYQSAREMRSDLRASIEGVGRTTPPVPSSPDLRYEQQSVRVLTSTPGAGHAATVEMPSPARSGSVADEAGAKPTLAGTAAAIPGAPNRRMAALVAALAVVSVGVGFAAVQLLRGRPAVVTASAGIPTGVPAETTLEPELPAGDVPPLDTANGKGGAHPTTAAAGSPLLHPAHSGSARAGAAAAPSGPAAAAVAPAVTAAATATATVAPLPSAPAPAPSVAAAAPLPASPGPADPAPDPDFDPEKAYVEIGLINAQGVRERAVRGALRGIGLAVCYRRALHAKGARVVGTATLDLSIDDSGATRSAIVSGAEFLPGLTRCVQGAASSTSVARTQVDSGGGTAEVTLAFRAP